MSFKKHNINKSSPAIVNIIWVISLFIIFLLWFFFIKNISFFNFETNNKIISNDNLKNTSQSATWILNKSWSLSEKIITSKKTDKIKSQSNKIKTYIQKKESKDKINILLAWRWWGSHDAPNLTDTIILVSIDTKSKIISMLSIPRDLYVEYPNLYNVNDKKWKINWLYAKYSFKSNSQKVWMKVLEDKITQITWEKIDYFVNIDFNWFKKIIDTIWGIEITVPKKFIDNRYPDWNWGYKTLIFKKWTWIFDGENALKYARSRIQLVILIDQ
jgi:LCP family protein required for cell wall assembly